MAGRLSAARDWPGGRTGTTRWGWGFGHRCALETTIDDTAYGYTRNRDRLRHVAIKRVTIDDHQTFSLRLVTGADDLQTPSWRVLYLVGDDWPLLCQRKTTRHAHHIVFFAHPSSINGPLPPSQERPHPLGKPPRAAAQ
jgi:hypothetical protein